MGPEVSGGLYPQICTLAQDAVEICLDMSRLVCKHSPHRDEGKSAQFLAGQIQIKVPQNKHSAVLKVPQTLASAGRTIHISYIIFLVINTISDSRPVVRVILEGGSDQMPHVDLAATLGTIKYFVGPEVVLGKESNFLLLNRRINW